MRIFFFFGTEDDEDLKYIICKKSKFKLSWLLHKNCFIKMLTLTYYQYKIFILLFNNVLIIIVII